MSRIQFVVAYWLVGALLRGAGHQCRLTEFFMLVRVRARQAFPEDSGPALIAFLEECFEDAMGAKEFAGAETPTPKEGA